MANKILHFACSSENPLILELKIQSFEVVYELKYIMVYEGRILFDIKTSAALVESDDWENFKFEIDSMIFDKIEEIEYITKSKDEGYHVWLNRMKTKKFIPLRYKIYCDLFQRK